MGRGNDRVANIQEQFAADASSFWLESLERSLAMMKEYQVSPLPFPGRRVVIVDHVILAGCSQEARISPASP
jgi:hypothetical protein